MNFLVDPMPYFNMASNDINLAESLGLPSILLDNRLIGPKQPGVVRLFWYSSLRHPVLKASSYATSQLAVVALALVCRPRVVHYQGFRLNANEVGGLCSTPAPKAELFRVARAHGLTNRFSPLLRTVVLNHLLPNWASRELGHRVVRKVELALESRF